MPPAPWFTTCSFPFSRTYIGPVSSQLSEWSQHDIPLVQFCKNKPQTGKTHLEKDPQAPSAILGALSAGCHVTLQRQEGRAGCCLPSTHRHWDGEKELGCEGGAQLCCRKRGTKRKRRRRVNG